MDIEVKKHPGGIIEISPKGDLDTTTSESFAEKLDTILADDVEKAFINFEHVSYVSSLGIGEIIMCWDKMKSRGGMLKFTGMSPAVFKVFDLVGLTTRFKIFPTVEDTLASFD